MKRTHELVGLSVIAGCVLFSCVSVGGLTGGSGDAAVCGTSGAPCCSASSCAAGLTCREGACSDSEPVRMDAGRGRDTGSDARSPTDGRSGTGSGTSSSSEGGRSDGSGTGSPADGGSGSGTGSLSSSHGSSGTGTGSKSGTGSSSSMGYDGGCPATHGGPTLVNVGPFCIDGTETTNAQYEAFLATSPSLSLQPASVCAWNTSYVPAGVWPVLAPNATHPVVNVNWCQAYAFCKWAGKRLCGAVDGGSADFNEFASVNNEHYYACSAAGAHLYPYGSNYEPHACNDPEADAGGTVAVGSLGGCQGGFPHLYDLVGNVEEWQDSCSGTLGATDDCLDGAGAFNYPSVTSGPPACASADSDARSSQYSDLGIRCCAP